MNNIIKWQLQNTCHSCDDEEKDKDQKRKNKIKLPGFNTREQQTKLTTAETSSVCRNLVVPEPVVENARPTAEDRKKCM